MLSLLPGNRVQGPAQFSIPFPAEQPEEAAAPDSTGMCNNEGFLIAVSLLSFLVQ